MVRFQKINLMLFVAILSSNISFCPEIRELNNLNQYSHQDFETALRNLGLDPDNFDIGNAKKNYLKLSLVHHPDKNKGNENATANFQNLNNSHEYVQTHADNVKKDNSLDSFANYRFKEREEEKENKRNKIESDFQKKLDEKLAAQKKAHDLIQRFTTADIKTLDEKQIKILTPEHIEALSPDQIRTFRADQIKALTHDQIKALTNDQLKAMRPNQIKEFTPDQIEAFTHDQLNSFTDGQLSFLEKNYPSFRDLIIHTKTKKAQEILNKSNPINFEIYNLHNNNDLNSRQKENRFESIAENLTGDEIKGLTPENIARIQSFLSTEQLLKLTPEQMIKLNINSYAKLIPTLFKNPKDISIDFLKNLPIDSLRYISVENIESLNDSKKEALINRITNLRKTPFLTPINAKKIDDILSKFKSF